MGQAVIHVWMQITARYALILILCWVMGLAPCASMRFKGVTCVPVLLSVIIASRDTIWTETTVLCVGQILKDVKLAFLQHIVLSAVYFMSLILEPINVSFVRQFIPIAKSARMELAWSAKPVPSLTVPTNVSHALIPTKVAFSATPVVFVLPV